MREVTRSALVPYTAEQMFALVADIERYPEFVPWIIAAEKIDSGPNQVTGRLVAPKSVEGLAAQGRRCKGKT